jgi:hypothetical protein
MKYAGPSSVITVPNDDEPVERVNGATKRVHFVSTFLCSETVAHSSTRMLD